MKKAIFKANLYYITSVFCFVISAGFFIVPIIIGLKHERLSYLIGTGLDKVMIISFILAASFIVFGLFFNAARNKERLKYEYDEFGVKKNMDMYGMDSKDRKQLEVQKFADMERIIPRDALDKMTKRGALDPEVEMGKLVGLAGVKREIDKLKSRIVFETKNKKSDYEVGHMIFYGAPGTGKTTVARIITGILYRNKLIKENKLVEVDGNFLKSGNAEDTMIKTKTLIRRAYGGVLFIDEAYALAIEGDRQGEAAVATLIKEMEDNRDKFVCILAGYPDEMKTLLDLNPGFRSRIKTYFNFADYNESDLRDIAIKIGIEEGFVISNDGMDAILVRLSKERNKNTWGNARTVRNVIDETISNHAMRVNTNKNHPDKFVLTNEDVDKNCHENI